MNKKLPYFAIVALLLAALACSLSPNQAALPPQSDLQATAEVMSTQVSVMETQAALSEGQEDLANQLATLEALQTQMALGSEVDENSADGGNTVRQELEPTNVEPTRAPTSTTRPMPTATDEPTEVVTTTAQVSATSLITYTVVDTQSLNGWDVRWLEPSQFDRGDGTTFKEDAEDWDLRELAPELWPTFPNVPNPLVDDFKVVTCADDPNAQCVPDGVEYANAESNFCQQLAGEACRVPIAARHYLYFSGDYDIPGIGQCSENGTGIGCLLIVDNVGEVTADITGIFQQGFRLHARYWNGDELDMAMWALASHGVNVMTNMNSRLNPDDFANAGSNCSVPSGCEGVHVQWVVITGNVPMMNAEATYVRTTGSYIWDWFGRRLNDLQAFVLN